MDNSLSQRAILAQFNKTHNIADIQQIVAMRREELNLAPAASLERSQILLNLGIALHVRFILDGLLPDLEEAILLLRQALPLLPASNPHRLHVLQGLASALSTRFQQTGRLPDLTDPIAMLREALLLMSGADLDRPAALRDLAIALLNRNKWHNGRWDSADMVEAINLLREASALQPELHVDGRIFLHQLARALRFQYLQSSAQNDALILPNLPILDEAIQIHRDALEEIEESNSSISNSDHSPALFSHLALALQTRFAATRLEKDLEEAIALHRKAIQLLPGQSPDESELLTNLVVALHARYENIRQHDDLLEAMSTHHAALLLPARRRLGHSYSFNVLEPVLRSRFSPMRRTPCVSDTELPDYGAWNSVESLVRGTVSDSGAVSNSEDLSDLDEAIESCRRDLASQADDRAVLLDKLAVALYSRFTRQTDKFRDDSTISESIELHDEALKLRCAPHPERASSLHNLALAYHALYMTRYNTPSMDSLLDTSVSLFREALLLRPLPHPDRSSTLNGLGVALHTRFEHGGKRLDLDESIMLHREALDLCPFHHPDRASTLTNLAAALQTRSVQTRQPQDLREAITLHDAALDLRPEPHPERPVSLHKLGLAHHALFCVQRSLSDLDVSIAYYRGGLALQSDMHPGRPSSLSDLAVALRSRYQRMRELKDLDDALGLHREALLLLPEGHYDRIPCLINLANVLILRFEEIGRAKDLDIAIELCRETLQGFHRHDRDNPVQSLILEPFGRALVARFLRADEVGNSGQDLMDAADAYQAIVDSYSTPLSQRFPAARMWARLSDAMDDGHGLALQQYRITIELLPLLAGAGVDVQSRQRALTLGTDGLAREAAACAIRQQKYPEAVELLEAGRAVFWSLALQLRTPLHDLEAAHPQLARRFLDISHSLEQGALRDMSGTTSGSEGSNVSSEKENTRYRQLEADWMELIEQIRAQDGFHNFLEHRRFDTLSAAAANGIVVILNASSFRAECDALALVGSEVVHIPLKNLTYRQVELLAKHIRMICGTSFPSVPQSRGVIILPHKAKDADSVLRDVLGILWKLLTRPIFESLRLKASILTCRLKSNSPPRLWWMATGPFASLPIHAAGVYDPNGDTLCVNDYVVSSYTPTLNALLAERPPTTEEFKMLVAIQPTTPGQQSLKFTTEELRMIEKHIPAKCLITYGSTPGKPTLVQNILRDMPAVSIAHFACHGVQDARNPLNSALLLDDRLRVSKLMELDMRNASLVFLSACQTAAGDEQLPDEPMHLAATLLFTGFREAVATMWSIHDEDGPRVADAFYHNLLASRNPHTQNTPDYTSAAHALHCAIKVLCAEGCSLMRWVPFIHLGL
ncbi:uncharacterized protein FIBRA_02545 [Fibroporia radiculosa]|uniref:CHAT domain-containing protein n=1 Tax=Fibroporia radiculosa TaxID=599839 RepID=J4I943_9APHY|nr:uncharacterized protein FIBRA_02545 [Fibroporia radiculosa]CCM00511.1 predicted protein [Fibroporia radiculosa]